MAKLDRTDAFAWNDPDEIEVISEAEYKRITAKDRFGSLPEDTEKLSERARRLADRSLTD